MKLKIIGWAVVVLVIVIAAISGLTNLLDVMNISLLESGNIGTLPSLIIAAFCAMALIAVFVWSGKWKTLGIWLCDKAIRIMKKYGIEVAVIVAAIFCFMGLSLFSDDVGHGISQPSGVIAIVCTIAVVVVFVVLIIKGKIPIGSINKITNNSGVSGLQLPEKPIFASVEESEKSINLYPPNVFGFPWCIIFLLIVFSCASASLDCFYGSPPPRRFPPTWGFIGVFSLANAGITYHGIDKFSAAFFICVPVVYCLLWILKIVISIPFTIWPISKKVTLGEIAFCLCLLFGLCVGVMGIFAFFYGTIINIIG